MSKIKYKPTPNEYFKQFPGYKKPKYSTDFMIGLIPKLKKDLKSAGITFYYVKWSKKIVDEDPGFEQEYFYSDVNPTGNYVVLSEQYMYWESTKANGKIRLSHSLDEHAIPIFNRIFCKYLPGRTRGWQNKSDSISVEFVKKAKLKIDKPKDVMYMYVHFTNKNIKAECKLFLPMIEKIIGKYGVVYSYDFIVGNPWYVEIGIDSDKTELIKNKLSEISEINKNKVKKIEFI